MRKHLSKLFTANAKTSNLIRTKIISNKMVMGLCSLFAATYTAQVSANSGKSRMSCEDLTVFSQILHILPMLGKIAQSFYLFS